MADDDETASGQTNQPITFAGEKFGHHASNVLEAAEEAFPVVPHVMEVYASLAREIDQGIADGSISGTDKDRILELRDKYEDIWEQHAKESAQWKDQANAEIHQGLQEDLAEFNSNHPDVHAEINEEAGPVIADAATVEADHIEVLIDRANEFTDRFLDSAQVYLDFTRELAELRSHQDGADT
ncbi:MAG TPA: hypothetical protein VMU01_04125, partial [Rhizomicrobium sp.]|nr:hypothetical protein [Rhizomicrobium sp.]